MNTTIKLKNFDMTVDEALVYMAQLNGRKQTLDVMRKRLPMRRVRSNRYGEQSNFVEYEKANYPIAAAEQEYQRLRDLVSRLQLDIDYINQTVTFNVDL